MESIEYQKALIIFNDRTMAFSDVLQDRESFRLRDINEYCVEKRWGVSDILVSHAFKQQPYDYNLPNTVDFDDASILSEDKRLIRGKAKYLGNGSKVRFQANSGESLSLKDQKNPLVTIWQRTD